MDHPDWPSLKLDDWEATYLTLHRFTQVMRRRTPRGPARRAARPSSRIRASVTVSGTDEDDASEVATAEQAHAGHAPRDRRC